jgi:cell wall-associated NlpC family hydrolase
MGGDAVPSIDTFLESDEPNQVGIKVAYLSNATNDRQDILDSLHGAQAALDAEVGRLEQARADAAELEATARTAREGARQAVADEEAIYAQVQGELADLVAAEEARRAAEQQRRAEEAARQAAEEAAQAEPPAAPSQDEVVELNEDPPESAVTTTPTTTPSQPTPEPEPVPGGATPGADVAVAAGLSQIGVPYVWAGSSPSTGFDCSGFTSWAWAQAGRSLPHSAAAQGGMVRQLPLSQLLPGDLVFYGFGYVHHVALYIGGGSIVHAPGSGRHVRVDSIYYWDDLHYAGRLP